MTIAVLLALITGAFAFAPSVHLRVTPRVARHVILPNPRDLLREDNAIFLPMSTELLRPVPRLNTSTIHITPIEQAIKIQARNGRSFLAWYNRKLSTAPFTTKSVSTGVTYVLSDLTAQGITGSLGVSPLQSVARALKFGAVGALWVGPLLTIWFQTMDRMVPGKSTKAVGSKLALDQLLQGPFMIATMFLWCGLSQGASLAMVQGKIQTELFSTWVKSVYVWAPIQVIQQAVVPIHYRVLVANGVSYFWDTFLAMKMM